MFQTIVSLSSPACSSSSGANAGETERAQRVEHLVGGAQVGLGVGDQRAAAGELGAARFEHGGDLGRHRQVAEIAAPGHAHPVEAAGTTGSSASAGASTDSGSRASRPASAPSSSAASSTVRAIGPTTASEAHGSDWSSAAGIRPGDGRSPTTLQNDAGLRMLDARSDPSANGSIPVATAAAAPPLLPPAVRVRSYGLRVAPNTRLNVCEPAPNSGVLVLPITIAPARRRRSTSRLSASGTCSAKIVEP